MWTFVPRSILIVVLLLNLPTCVHATVTLTNNSLSAFTSALANGGLINLAFNGTITATNTFQVNSNTTLNAAGFTVTISGGNSNRIFTVATNITFSATNLVIAFGNSRGANGSAGANGTGSGVNGGNGTAGNDGLGGAVYNQGTNYFVNCSFLTNTCTGGAGGAGGAGGNGGFGADGGAGGAGGNGYGAAIFNLKAVVLSNCTFTGNSATAGNGGAGGTNGTPQFSNIFPGTGGVGGAAAGAGLYSTTTANAIIYGCTFNGNSVLAGNTQKRGGAYNGNGNGVAGQAGGNATGGGVCNLGTNVTINCTFYTNIVHGGNGGAGEDDGPSGFDGGAGGNGGSGLGGNLYNSGLISVTNCTLSSGEVFGGSGGLVGNGPFTNQSNGSTGTASGANIYSASGTFNFKNSILASPVNGSNGAGSLTDQGNNISDDTTPTFGTNSFNNLNPHLGALTNNGGPTLTMAITATSPAYGLADTNAAPAQDQRGYWWYAYASSGAYDYGATPLPTIYLLAFGPAASEDGDVGVFFIERSSSGGPGPITINYTIGGTATNGVHYSTITNSVTFAPGVYFTNILIQTVPGSFAGTNLTVVLTLSTNTQYQLSADVFDTVILYPHSTLDPTARFVRGTTTAPEYQSFVIPLDGETGVPLSAVGGNAATLFPGNPWTNNFWHFNGTNLSSQSGTNGRIVFQNPIVAFGSPVGGSPLYLNQNYRFGMSAGISSSILIQVYARSNASFVGTISLPVPNLNDPIQLNSFLTNGFTASTNAFGLQTTLFMPSTPGWGMEFLYAGNFVMTHSASGAATNYYYEVQDGGFTPWQEYMARDASGVGAYSKMYVMEFSPFPTGRSTFVDQPQFNGIPLPPTYQGMSLQELTNVVPTLPNLSSLTASNYLTIDGSPELRRHPILDQFVKNMNNDPLALANYVINEIDLTDAIDYDTNFNSQPAINLGGVDRGALATFQEGQGSPVEQCALLIYLLRQAGVPAAYVYPTNNGLQMLDIEVSKLLHVQLHGALSEIGQTNLPQLISVNYPWVAAYIGTNWVQIFPWLKDTSIIEGLDLYDYMPTNYNSGYLWLTHFIAGDTNIFSLSSSDQPLDLLPLFIQKNLDANFPGISVDDLGVKIMNRRHLYSQWGQFPLPFALSGTPTVVESLSTNVNLFNTLDILVYSQANTNNYIDTRELPALYFHDRKLLLNFVQLGGSNLHTMSLVLDSYSTNITTTNAFASSSDPTWTLTGGTNLTSTDDNIIFQVTHRRNKFLPTNYIAPNLGFSTNLWNFSYFEQGEVGSGQTYLTTNTFRKGDLVAFCLDVGRVSQAMLNVQAQAIWQYNQTATTNNANPNTYLGTTLYLMGMSYFNYIDRFSAFDDPLHKVQMESAFQYGFGLLRPLRNSTGALTNNGAVIPITPAVHMPNNGLATVFNNSLRSDSGQDSYSVTLDWWLQMGVQGSAAEHGILEAFCQTNAVSSVKLLQQAGTNTVALNALNYLSAATNLYNGVQLQNADTNIWATVVAFLATNDYNRQAFLTPGVVTNGTFAGVAGILFSQAEFNSPVSGLNGGYANSFPTNSFSTANSPNVTVVPAPDGATSPYTLVTTSPVSNSAEPVDGATTAEALATTATNLANGTDIADPNLQQAATNMAALLGTANNAAGVFDAAYLNQGTLDTTLPTYNDKQALAAEPVNVMSGEFYIDAVDLTLPGPLNLQVRRNYSSQNLLENQFGFGWKLNYMPFLSVGTNATLIYAAEMDGSVVAYRQTNVSYNIWVPTTSDNPTLNNNSSAGIGSVGNLFNNVLRLATISGTNVYTLTGADGSVRTFITNAFAIDGFNRLRPYLNSWQDNRGNSYSFAYGSNPTQPDWGQLNRIQSSNGNFLGFYYDVYGHIIQAYTGDGRILQYIYDKFGDLITVTLPDQSEINYVYQHANQITNSVTNIYSTHLILQELKPNGRILQNAYDSQRRVTNQMSTVGGDLNPIRTATFVYTNTFSLSSPTNLLTGTTTLLDYTNHITTYYYTNSLINVVVDPLGQTITQTWYGASTNGGYQRSLSSRTDKRGLVTSYQYDAFGNVISTTLTGDLTGNGVTTNATTSATYNTNNLPLLLTDPLGNGLQFVYSTTYLFLPQQVIRLAGTNAVMTNFFFYTNATNVLSNGTNTAFGLLTRTIRAYSSPDASTNDLFYNGDGFVTNAINYTSTSDPPVTNQFFYDERGELVQHTDAAGRSFNFAFDPMGRPTARETFESGQTIPMDWSYAYYNANGDLFWTDGARYNPEDYVWRDYDGDGRMIQEIRWRSQANPSGSGVSAAPGYNLYATSFYQYDPLGDLTQATDPLGNYVVQSFDAIGQLTQQVYYGSNGTALATNYYSHEHGGLISAATNALGGVTTKLYTATGKLKFQQNPDASTHSWIFDLTGRLTQETLANGNFWQTIYSDGTSTITNIFHNGSGPLATNITQLDRRGNVTQIIDAYRNVWTRFYDGLDRIKIASGPATTNVLGTGISYPPTTFLTNVLQEVTTYIYDKSGKVLTVSNALGETTVTTSDAIGRPIQVAFYPSNSVTPVRITTSVYSADHNSVTVTTGTGTNAIVTTSYTDTDGQPLLSIGYPTNGVTEYTWWQYDLAGNPIAQQQCSSNSSGVTIWATNGWTYDGLNRVLTETSKDGAVTTNCRDAMGNVTNRAMPGQLTWSATYFNDGRITSEKETGGGLSARSTTYAYYGTNSSFVGQLYTVTDGRSTSRTNIYDDFMRLAAVNTTGGTAQQQTSTTYNYDLNSRLTGVNQAFNGTNVGPSTSIARSYYVTGRLADEDVTDSNGYFSRTIPVWDDAGRRTQLSIIQSFWNTPNVSFSYQADGLMTSSGPGNSFGYANNGLLTNRNNGSRNYTINRRDGRGRIVQTTTSVAGANVLAESLSWRNDGRLNSYVATNSNFTDSRNYSYSSLAQRLTQESLYLGTSQPLTNNYTIDNGQTGGLGILTSKTESGIESATWTAALTNAVDGLSRVAYAQDSLINRSAYGTAAGAAAVSATLDGNPVNISFDGSGGSGQWRADLDMSSGSHTFHVSAVDSIGDNYYSNSVFTVASNSVDTITNAYDGNGNITQRMWVNSLGQTNRVQTLTWDAFDRLIQVVQRDPQSNGFNWTAVYDGLGRRLSTINTMVISNAPVQNLNSSNLVNEVDSIYDPEVEFLELGVVVNGVFTLKLYGPDVNGTYGGMNGVGGLESLTPVGLSASIGVLQDYFGNVVGTINGSAVSWNPTRFSSYGPVPGFQSPSLSFDTSLALSLGWRGKRVDETGLIYLGARHYDSVAGRFLNADPLGQGSSMDLYSFCDGDPVNHWDSDGRLSAAFYQNQNPNNLGISDLYNQSSQFRNLLQSSFPGNFNGQNWDSLSLSERLGGIELEAGGTFGPSASVQVTSSFSVGSFVTGNLLNGQNIQEGLREMDNADFSSALGVATFTVAVIDVGANVLDAAGNVITLGGKGWLEGSIKTGIKDVAEIGAKDATTTFRQTGAGYLGREADAAYQSIRASTSDVTAIAENTGFKPENIQAIKDHLFNNEHLLDRYVDQGVPATMALFDSDASIAEAWTRLQNGTFNQADIQLLKHETAEAWYMNKYGQGYNAAHNAAEARFPAPKY